MKYLAIDYGEKRLGLAGSDSGIVAQPLEIVTITDSKQINAQILAAIDKHTPEEIVIGMPVNEDGSEGRSAQIVREFGKLVEEKYKNVHYVNEFLTSQEAQVRSGRRPQEPVDDHAAAIILEQFLAHRNT